MAWVYAPPGVSNPTLAVCWLKGWVPAPNPNNKVISGVKGVNVKNPPGIIPIHSLISSSPFYIYLGCKCSRNSL